MIDRRYVDLRLSKQLGMHQHCPQPFKEGLIRVIDTACLTQARASSSDTGLPASCTRWLNAACAAARARLCTRLQPGRYAAVIAIA